MKPDRLRVALSISPDLDRVLTRIAVATGTGKATFVREWLHEALPQLLQLATAMELAKQGNIDALSHATAALRSASAESDQLLLDIRKTRRAAMRKRAKP